MDAPDASTPESRPRKRAAIWIALVLAVLVITALLVWAGRSLKSSEYDRWLPERAGNVTVLEKLKLRHDYTLNVRLPVPAASPAEAALVSSSTSNRAAIIGEHLFDVSVPVTQEQWETVEKGAQLRAMYHINVRRSDVFVSSLYMDALAPQ